MAASGQKEEAAHWRPLQRQAGQNVVPSPVYPEPQKRNGQILVTNCIAGEAVVTIVPSNSFDCCNYATSASDRRIHEILIGVQGAISPTPLPPFQQPTVYRASMVTVWSAAG